MWVSFRATGLRNATVTKCRVEPCTTWAETPEWQRKNICAATDYSEHQLITGIPRELVLNRHTVVRMFNVATIWPHLSPGSQAFRLSAGFIMYFFTVLHGIILHSLVTSIAGSLLLRVDISEISLGGLQLFLFGDFCQGPESWVLEAWQQLARIVFFCHPYAYEREKQGQRNVEKSCSFYIAVDTYLMK